MSEMPTKSKIITYANGLALALTSAAGTVAAVAVGEEQTGTGGEENCWCDKYAFFSRQISVVVCGKRTTLLHGETYKIVSLVALLECRFPMSMEKGGVVCVPCLSLPPVILKM